jgi:Zn ribbon nucleic-acid-binding protein
MSDVAEAILLAMQDDPVRYWQDLSENYRQMSDGELLELAEKPEDLTEVARQVLRDEIRRRGLDEKPADTQMIAASNAGTPARIHWEPASYRNAFSSIEEEKDDAHEYTWKVVLTECASPEEAWQVAETLRRSGIESWIRRYNPFSQYEGNVPAVLVAADELERARVIAAMPIPQDIIDESQIKLPEFALPVCPDCGSTDGALLESADPVNVWSCEACGAEWSDEDESASDEDEEESQGR